MTSIPEITDVMTKVQNAGESGGVLLYVNEKTNEFETAAKWNLCDRLSLSWRGFTNNAEKVAGKIDQLFRNLVIKDDERPTYDRNKAVYQEALQKFKTRITTNSIDRNNLLTSALFVTKTARTVLRIALPQPGPEPLPAPIPSAPVQPASTVTFGQTRRKHGLQVVESSTHPHRENCAPTSPTLSPSSGSSASEPDKCSPSSDRSPRSPSTFREK
ncbi:MAG TPA: hypothetical protein VLE89_01535 [Chlamydiales bacterium]|nr:hypothetical protein [Chlamydiales bacterium]